MISSESDRLLDLATACCGVLRIFIEKQCEFSVQNTSFHDFSSYIIHLASHSDHAYGFFLLEVCSSVVLTKPIHAWLDNCFNVYSIENQIESAVFSSSHSSTFSTLLPVPVSGEGVWFQVNLKSR